MIIGPPELPALCDVCGTRTPFADIPQDRYRLLLDDYYLHYFSAELRELEKVADFYRRNPSAKGRILTHADRVMESNDPKVMEQVADGVPFDEIELPPEPDLQLESPAPNDAEVIEYLKHNAFDLERRTAFVKGEIGDLSARVESVICTHCGQGRLHLLEEPHVATPGEIAEKDKGDIPE